SLAIDEQNAYCIYRWSSTVTLRAVSLADGRPVWTRHWTGPENPTWSIALAARHVVAYPDQSGPADGNDRERVPIIESMPVVVHRRETGALVQRFVLPADITNVQLKLDPAGVLVGTPRGVWGLGARAQQQHRLSGIRNEETRERATRNPRRFKRVTKTLP